MTIFFQILIVVLLLGAMIIILLGISQLTNPKSFEDENETSELYSEINDSEEVMSRHNMFHKLVEKKVESKNEKNSHFDSLQ